jgi:hypothetical protein
VAKPYDPSTIYRSRSHDSLKRRLIDTAIALGIGAVAALITWGIILLWWAA